MQYGDRSGVKERCSHYADGGGIDVSIELQSEDVGRDVMSNVWRY